MITIDQHYHHHHQLLTNLNKLQNHRPLHSHNKDPLHLQISARNRVSSTGLCWLDSSKIPFGYVSDPLNMHSFWRIQQGYDNIFKGYEQLSHQKALEEVPQITIDLIDHRLRRSALLQDGGCVLRWGDVDSTPSVFNRNCLSWNNGTKFS